MYIRRIRNEILVARSRGILGGREGRKGESPCESCSSFVKHDARPPISLPYPSSRKFQFASTFFFVEKNRTILLFFFFPFLFV